MFCLVFSAYSEEIFSNYKKYDLTKTKFKLDLVVKNLDRPWALTFINDEYLIVTERTGGLYKINIKTSIKKLIKHDIQHIEVMGTRWPFRCLLQ